MVELGRTPGSRFRPGVHRMLAVDPGSVDATTLMRGSGDHPGFQWLTNVDLFCNHMKCKRLNFRAVGEDGMQSRDTPDYIIHKRQGQGAGLKKILTGRERLPHILY